MSFWVPICLSALRNHVKRQHVNLQVNWIACPIPPTLRLILPSRWVQCSSCTANQRNFVGQYVKIRCRVVQLIRFADGWGNRALNWTTLHPIFSSICDGRKCSYSKHLVSNKCGLWSWMCPRRTIINNFGSWMEAGVVSFGYVKCKSQRQTFQISELKLRYKNLRGQSRGIMFLLERSRRTSQMC